MKNSGRPLLFALTLALSMAAFTQVSAAAELKYDGKGCAVYAENVGDRPEASITRFTGTGLPPGGGGGSSVVTGRSTARRPSAFF